MIKKHFRQSEISEFDMTLRIKEYVFGFEVSVDDISRVKVLQS